MLAQTLVLGKISFSVLSFWYYHILFYTKCDYQIKNSKFQEFLVFWFLSFVFLTNWMSRFQESNSLIRNSQFLNFSYLGILEFVMNVGFSQNGFSANKIPSFQIPSFVIPTKTFLVLSFPVSCVNQIPLLKSELLLASTAAKNLLSHTIQQETLVDFWSPEVAAMSFDFSKIL